MCRTALFRITGLLTALLATSLACPAPDDATTTIDVRLSWVVGSAGIASQPAELRNDVGLTIELDELYLSNFTVQLLPCQDPFDSAATAATVTTGWTAMGVAHAGHGDILGAAALQEPVLEWLGRRLPTLRIEAPRVEYCRVHYLVARQPTPQEFAREEGQTSLYVAGRASKGPESTDFAIHTKLAHGTVVDLPRPMLGDELVVELRRDLAKLFDGFTLVSLAERGADRQLLRNLIDGVQASAEPSESSP